jgi:hypothetical protein
MFKSDARKGLDTALLHLTGPFLQVCTGSMPSDFFDEVLQSRQGEISQLASSVRASDGEKGILKARQYVGTFMMKNYVGVQVGRSQYDEFMKAVDSLTS